jgi:hypothetical protein
VSTRAVRPEIQRSAIRREIWPLIDAHAIHHRSEIRWRRPWREDGVSRRRPQRDRARAIWSNLREVKDIGEALQTMAKFGNPQPL